MEVITLLDIENAFKNFLTTHNHIHEQPLRFNTSGFVRFACPHSSKRMNKDAAYRLFSDGVPSGYFKCWHCMEEADFCYKRRHEITQEEWLRHQKLISQRKSEHEERIKLDYFLASKEASHTWNNASVCINHPYLIAKQVNSYGLRSLKNNTLLIPCFNAQGKLMNLERIYLNKNTAKYDKRPLRGGQRIGVFYLIGKITYPQEIVYISEGYATAASIHEATGLPCAISFNCGNLPHVAQVLRKLYPKARIIVAADRDNNEVGEIYARKAAFLIGGSFVLPDFSIIPQEIKPEIKRSDFNDLFVFLMAMGLTKSDVLLEVRRQLNKLKQ